MPIKQATATDIPSLLSPMHRAKVGALLVTVGLLTATPVRAGECLSSSDAYLEAIQKVTIPKGTLGDAAERNELSANLFCLYSNVGYLMMGYQYFATPKAMEKTRRETESTRKLAFELLPQFLDSPSEEIRCSTASALAYYRWPQSYEPMMRCKASVAKAVLLAILGDRRAVPWIIEQYRLVGSKYRTHPEAAVPDKMTYLNALYHLASPESVPLLDEILQGNDVTEVKNRAEKVRKRIDVVNRAG